MQAIRIHQHGNADVLTVDELPVPAPGPDELLVQIKTAALNHLDIWVRNGVPGIALPLIMGSDAAGVIVEVGPGQTGDQIPKTGDEVILAPMRSCGQCEMCRTDRDNLCREFAIPGEQTDGLQAEYVVVPSRYVLPKPDNLSRAEAAALPLAALTAYHMLVRKADVQPGDWLLVYGASSGVGGAAIQIARALGAQVITTAGDAEKARLARELGADHVINYSEQPIGKTVKEITSGRGVDVVIEHTGAKTWPDSLRALKFGGTIVTCGATTGPKVQIDLRALFIKHQRIIGSTMGTLNDLHEVVQLAGQGRLKPHVDRVFSYQEIRAAHQRLEQGRQFGKIVIRF